MRVTGLVRFKLANSAEFEVELAAFQFVFQNTWEPSLIVVDIYEAEVSVEGEMVHLELLESLGPTGPPLIGPPLSLRVRPSCPSAAQIVLVVGLGQIDDNAPFPADPIVAVPSMTREAHITAYYEASESIAEGARFAVSEAPDLRERLVLEAVERMASIPRPYGARYFAVARQLFFDTGYYKTEVIAVPDGLSAAGLVGVMLGFSEGHRGVYTYRSDGVRRNYDSRPSELESIDASDITKIDVRTQFSTRGPGGTRPGLVYDSANGGFLFDGPSAARNAFRAAILSALALETEAC